MARMMALALLIAQVSVVSSIQLRENIGTLDPVLVSAIIPTCNRVHFLTTALGQLSAQDYPLLEAIVVDDSSDNELLDSLAKRSEMVSRSEIGNGDSIVNFESFRDGVVGEMLYVRVLKLSKAASIGEKRNRAYHLANGKVILQWDDDDIFPPTRISAQVLPILQGKAGMTVLEHKFFFESSKQQFLEHNQMQRLPSGEVVRYNDFFSKGHGALFLGTLAFDRSVFDKIGGYEHVNHGEDIRFIENALANCVPLLNIHGVPNVYVRHNNTEGGVHNTWMLSNLEQHLMYDYVHTVERPAFVTDRLLAEHRAAEKQAALKGTCNAPADPVSEFTIKHFPEMPSKCCSDDQSLAARGLGCEAAQADAEVEDDSQMTPPPPASATIENAQQTMVSTDNVAAATSTDAVVNPIPAAGEDVSEVLSSYAESLDEANKVVEQYPAADDIVKVEAPPVEAPPAATTPTMTSAETVVASVPAQDSVPPQSTNEAPQPAALPVPVRVEAQPTTEAQQAAPARDELSEAGYQAVAALKDNGRMGLFVRTLLESQGRVIANMDAFRALLPRFSGMQGVKSYEALVNELSHAGWAPPVSQQKK
eukprot:TRINITY_DN696_c0_g4_i1.p1 TRINITY_DN696_c0_g4~~TRINITY_DN696_c0_g4_i1.p1  ORF type:complete len:591 (-),score=133.67 TRINITY_DN696_c0_g4_i1:56-1828(-)